MHTIHLQYRLLWPVPQGFLSSIDAHIHKSGPRIGRVLTDRNIECGVVKEIGPQKKAFKLGITAYKYYYTL